ncbi:hypothetical protein F7734_50230 [Scytonema sp. UIC 10036]|uniref:hypothetical protein n=1 Tax=Scytonema sp. UIC 10036 TaxID=2304196 RepID=UPI0012DAD446|nr:hypothetical protein [Scytonema sp. UIC 10036]MUH00025.1 hypothetical protein [Scytonema sp. UIC 10036]
MTAISSKKKLQQRRTLPGHKLSLEEKLKRQAESEAFYQCCYVIFEKLSPELMSQHYNWFISIEPDTGDYIIAPNRDNLLLHSCQTYPHKRSFIFRLNETGVCGTI